MNKMLIVDDNKREREGVYNIIDWSCYDIEVCQMFSNGQNALEYMLNNPVDIVLSDVEMPVMDGIMLLKKMREHNIDSKFIFMSCYDQFEFVKSAMDLGASGYILKPISVSELEEMIKKVLSLQKSEMHNAEIEQRYNEIVEKNSTILEENFLRQLMFEKSDDEKLTKKEAEILKIPYEASNCRVACIKLYPKSTEKDDVMMLVSALIEKIGTMVNNDVYIKPVIIGHGQIAVIFLYDEKNSNDVIEICIEIKRYSRYELVVDTVFGVSDESKTGISELNLLYNHAIKAIESIYISGNEGMILYDEIDDNKPEFIGMIDINKLQRDVSLIISKKDMVAANELISRYLGEYDKVADKNYVRYFSYMLLNIIETTIVGMNLNTENIVSYSDMWAKLLKINTIVDIKRWFENVFKSVFETIEYSSQSKDQDIVNAVKEIIHSKYNSHLTMNYISEKVHFSSVHINNIFKKETGKAIFNYLMEYRMEIAKKLLAEPGSKVYAVAKAVGYTNQSHFKMLFTQYIGISPLEYKSIYEKNK